MITTTLAKAFSFSLVLLRPFYSASASLMQLQASRNDQVFAGSLACASLQAQLLSAFVTQFSISESDALLIY